MYMWRVSICVSRYVGVDKLSVVFFFFQAEDGIRDLYVTGVQTCALPISVRCACIHGGWALDLCRPSPGTGCRVHADLPRSEERRVGKECIARRSSYLSKKTLQYITLFYIFESTSIQSCTLHARLRVIHIT